MFSSGLPVIYLFIGGLLTTRYWVDKRTCIKGSSRPTYVLDERLNRWTHGWMIFALVLHSLLAIFMFSATELFPSTP